MALMKNISIILCIISIFVIDNACSAATLAPTPTVDCSSMILNMADCLTYVTNGSTVTKPEGTCCSGLKTVLKADATCLCEGFKSSAQLGVVLNVTKAMTLPSACHVSAPSLADCGLSAASGGAPAISPVSSPTSSPTSIGVAPGTSVEADEFAPAPAPAPSPGTSGSAFLSVSVASLVVGLVFASISSF